MFKIAEPVGAPAHRIQLLIPEQGAKKEIFFSSDNIFNNFFYGDGDSIISLYNARGFYAQNILDERMASALY